MLKKILLLILVLLCLMPSVCFADDSAIPDDKNRLTAEITFDSFEAQIGEDFCFTVTLTNNTDDNIRIFDFDFVFNQYTITEQDKEKYSSFLNSLEAGESVVIDAALNISQDTVWYKKGESFYTDFQLCLEFYYNDIDIKYDIFKFESEQVPIKITNLYDGSQLLSAETSMQNGSFIYGYGFKDKYPTISADYEVSISNLSEDYIDLLILRTFQSSPYYLEGIHSGQTRVQYHSFHTNYYTSEELPPDLPISNLVTFKVDGIYYGVQSQPTFPIKVIEFPNIEIIKDDNLIIKNSDKDFVYFYFDYDTNYDTDYDYRNYSSNHILLDYKEGDILEYALSDFRNKQFVIGYINNDLLFSWNVYVDTQKRKYILIQFLDVINIKESSIFADMFPADSPISSPSPTTTSQTPAPTSTHTPSPAPTVTASPTPAITINSVTKKPPVPYWVWIVLAAALIGTGIVLYVLGMRRSKKEQD